MPKLHDMETIYRIVGNAAEAGAVRTGPCVWQLDAAFRCENPIGFVHEGRPTAPSDVIDGRLVQPRHVVIDPKSIIEGKVAPQPGQETVDQLSMRLEGFGRCRRCNPCLRYRARTWRERAAREIERAARTWFVTFTLSAQRSYYYLELARKVDHTGGVDLDLRKDDDGFAKWCLQIGKELTLCLKRIRKNSGANLRYMFVFERHQSGAPHIHGLIHEPDAFHGVTKRTIQGSWHDGFSHCKLVDTTSDRAAYYVTKYIAKEAATRIRASLHYGEGSDNRADRISSALPSQMLARNLTMKGREQMTQDSESTALILTDAGRAI